MACTACACTRSCERARSGPPISLVFPYPQFKFSPFYVREKKGQRKERWHTRSQRVHLQRGGAHGGQLSYGQLSYTYGQDCITSNTPRSSCQFGAHLLRPLSTPSTLLQTPCIIPRTLPLADPAMLRGYHGRGAHRERGREKEGREKGERKRERKSGQR